MPAPPVSGRLIRRGLAVVRHHVRLHPRPFFFSVGGSLVYAVATVASSAVIGRVVDDVVTPRFEQGEVARAAVVSGLLAIVAVGLIKCAGIVTRRVFAWVVQANLQATLRRKVISRYLDVPLRYFRRHPTGELIAHAGADVEAATMVMAPLPWATGVFVLLTIAAAWLIATDVFLAAIGLVLLPSLLTLNVLFQRRMEEPATRAQDRFGVLSSVAYESIDGAMLVKTLGAEEAEVERFTVAAKNVRDARVDLAKLTASFDALLNSLPSVGIIAILLLGAWRVQAGAVTAGTLVAFANLLNLLAWPLRLVGWVLGDLPRTIAGFDRVRGVLETSVEPGQSVGRTSGERLHVRGVRFAYEDGTEVLHDVTFSVAPGTTAALVGPTGCGKSTLLQVIAGLLEPQAGAVDADAPVALAFQEPFVFADTVQENVVLGRDVAASVYDEAVSVAQASEFIQRLPGGPLSLIGERGATLSGGQRQRLALARALAREPRVLLLDDATSSVDPATEADILLGLASARGGMTVLMVATRPSTIALADQVVFLAGGQVVASGPHRDLLRTVPAYAELVQAYETARLDDGEPVVEEAS